MGVIGTYDRKIFYNPATKYCVVSMKSEDPSIPEKARAARKYKDHLIRFTAVGYELPLTDVVEVELEGEWISSRHGLQLQVEQWREIVPKTQEGVISYLSSGLIKGIGEKTAADMVARFGVHTLDILERQPERLLEIRGITENRLEDIKASYAENRMLQDLMNLLAPFKLTPKTALKIYQHFGPASLEILKKSPFELCQISGFGFRRVDAIVQKAGGSLNDPMRIRGAIHCALGEARTKQGHLYLPREDAYKAALKLLNEKIPVQELRIRQEEAETVLQDMVLGGAVVSVKDNLYHPSAFSQEDETARQIAMRLIEPLPKESIAAALEQVKEEFGLTPSERQETAVQTAFQYNTSIITGSPGTGKTTVLKIILEVYRKLHADKKILLMAPTGRASRRMAESTGFDNAKTMHSGLGLGSGEDENLQEKKEGFLDAGLIIIDEFSMVDMWLAMKFFTRLGKGTKLVMVGDPDQLPSVGPGNVFHELIQCGLIPVTVLNQIFRQSEDSLIAYNARFIREGESRLYYGNDFVFLNGQSQEEISETILELYLQEISESGIERVQILSPFRAEGAASADQMNLMIRELVNPYQSEEDEIRLGAKSFRVGDRIMQTKNVNKISNGDLGFIRSVKDTPEGKRIGLDFGGNRQVEYGLEDLVNLDYAYATTIHKAMGSEYDTIIMPVAKAHSIMLYRNLLYTGISREKKKVILVGQKSALFMAIHKTDINKRNTLLGARIGLYYKAFAKGVGIAVPDILEEKLKNAS